MMIVYCETCGFRIQEEELSSGKAAQVAENRFNCAKCTAAAAPKRTTTGSATIQPRKTPDGAARPPSGGTSVIRPKSTVMRSASASAEVEAVQGDKRIVRKPLPLVPIVGGATIVLVVVAMVVALNTGLDTPVAKTDPAKESKETAKTASQTSRVEERTTAPANALTAPAERPEDRMRKAMEETARLSGAPATGGPVTQPPPNSTTRSVGPQMLAQPDAAADVFNERAGRMLKELQDGFAKNSGDPWTYKEKFETFSQTYRSAPAGAEAKKIASEIKLPPESARPVERTNWQKEWAITPGSDQTTFHEEFAGRRFVYQSHPIASGVPGVMTHTFVVPQDRSFFELWIRGHDAGDCRIVMSVSGFEMMSEIVGGGNWRNFTLDLSPLKGKTVDIALIHHNTDWNCEFAYMTAPHFIDKPAPDAKVVAWDAKNTAAVFAKNNPGTIDLLAHFDPATDVVVGGWTKTPEGLLGTVGKDHRIQFPYVPPPEYDLRVSFTRKQGSNCITLIGSHGERDFLAMYAGWDGKYAGLARIDGKNVDASVTRNDFNQRIKNGQKYTAVLEVRNNRLKMLLDSETISDWNADYNTIECDANWRPRDRFALSVGTYDSVYVIHSVEVVEIGLQGRSLRGDLARKSPTTDATPTTAATASPATSTSTGNADADYAAASDEAFGMLAKGNTRAAREQLEKLAADSRFSAQKAKLAFDLSFVKMTEAHARAIVKGAQALSDGRPFVFQQPNGKNLTVGRGSKNNVKDATEAMITVEQDLGGGKALTRVPVEQLLPQTRFELARIGQQAEPDGDVQTALAALLLVRSGQGEFPPRAIRSMLDAAKKKPEHAKITEYLADRFDGAGKEVAAEQAYRKAEQAYAARKLEDAKKLLETLEKDHGSTAFWSRNRANVAKITEELTKALTPREKGLMFEYCRPEGGERFKEVKLRRPESKLNFEWGDGEPAPGVDRDFSIRAKGLLRCEKGGRYGFWVRADDIGILSIDGKVVVNAGTNSSGEGEIDLTPGEHAIFIEFQDTGGAAVLQVRWRLVGGFDLQDIPDSALWYDPKAK